MKSRTFVFGDIHGCYLTFKALFEMCEIEKADSIYLLGDYIDRGPSSKNVLDFIFELYEYGYKVFPIRGNHEQMFLDSLNSEEIQYLWQKNNGGNRTLKSFGVQKLSEIPAKYIDWIKDLHYYYELRKFVIVHAGLNFHRENPFEDKNAMIWTRDRYYDKTKLNKRIIIGHTPTTLEKIQKSLQENIIFLDGGCVYFDNPELGNLCALELSEMKLYTQKNID